jgi:hypothetical protein
MRGMVQSIIDEPGFRFPGSWRSRRWPNRFLTAAKQACEEIILLIKDRKN